MSGMIKIMIVLCVVLFLSNTIMYMGMSVYIIRNSRKYKISIGKTSLFLTYLFSQITIGAVFFYAAMDYRQLLILTGALIENVCAFVILRQLRKIFDDVVESVGVDEEYEHILRKSEIEKKYYKMMEEYEDSLAKLRHEFINQVQVAYQVIEESDNRKVGEEMLDTLSKQIEATRVNAFCSNRMVNIIITMKNSEFLEMNVNLKNQVFLAGEIGIEEMDLCSVIMSVFDELIEIENLYRSILLINSGSVELSDQEINRKTNGEIKSENRTGTKREVSMDIRRKNGMVRIMTTSPLFADKENLKKIFDNYERSIRGIVEKYQGEIYVRTENVITILVIMKENAPIAVVDLQVEGARHGGLV